MIGRPGGRIGVDVYPRSEAAQGVWRLNEIGFEARFRSWPLFVARSTSFFSIARLIVEIPAFPNVAFSPLLKVAGHTNSFSFVMLRDPVRLAFVEVFQPPNSAADARFDLLFKAEPATSQALTFVAYKSDGDTLTTPFIDISYRPDVTSFLQLLKIAPTTDSVQFLTYKSSGNILSTPIFEVDYKIANTFTFAIYKTDAIFGSVQFPTYGSYGDTTATPILEVDYRAENNFKVVEYKSADTFNADLVYGNDVNIVVNGVSEFKPAAIFGGVQFPTYDSYGDTTATPLLEVDYGAANNFKVVEYKIEVNTLIELNYPPVLLLHMDGANNSDVFTDSALQPNNVRRAGNAVISTTQNMAGFGAAGAFNLSGYAGDYLDLPDGPQFNLSGRASWTIEAWIYSLSRSSYGQIINKRAPQWEGRISWQLYLEITTGRLGFYTGGIYVSTTAVPLNAWTHVAASYDGVLRLFVNGTKVDEFNDVVISNIDYPVRVGAWPDSYNPEYFSGYIDELRVLRGVTAYRNTFPRPTSPFPSA